MPFIYLFAFVTVSNRSNPWHEIHVYYFICCYFLLRKFFNSIEFLWIQYSLNFYYGKRVIDPKIGFVFSNAFLHCFLPKIQFAFILLNYIVQPYYFIELHGFFFYSKCNRKCCNEYKYCIIIIDARYASYYIHSIVFIECSSCKSA